MDNRYKKKTITTLYILLLVIFANAQQDITWPSFKQAGELRSVYQQSIKYNNNYSSTFDGGSYIGIGNNIWNRWGLRGGLKKSINSIYAFEMGYMYNHVVSGTNLTQEHRPHQSLHVNFPRFKHSVINHRFQIEERFFNTDNSNSTDFSSRLRYQISNNGRLRKKAVEPNTYYYLTSLEWNFNIYNEIKGKTLLRGRYGLGCGYRLNNWISIDATFYLEHNAIEESNRHSVTNILLLRIRHSI